MKIPPLSIKVENKQQEQEVCRVLESAGLRKEGSPYDRFPFYIDTNYGEKGIFLTPGRHEEEISYTDFMEQFGVTNYSNSMLNQENVKPGMVLIDGTDSNRVLLSNEYGFLMTKNVNDGVWNVGFKDDDFRFLTYSKANEFGIKFEDETVKEMTVEEVSKLVGTKVKIVEG